MTTPAELLTRFRATPDISAFLKVCSVGELRQLTRAYRSSHGLQESDGRAMYPKKSSSPIWLRPRKTAVSVALHSVPRFRYNGGTSRASLSRAQNTRTTSSLALI
jgi:hypothetical protein